MSTRSSDNRSPSDKESQVQTMLFKDSPIPELSVENWRQSFPEIIGRSESMRKVLETVSKVARSDCSVLILGESGTGKELIAASIHRLSPRSHKPFIPINCSAIPETLLESELFGHEKGAYTGADRRRVGHFEAASGGTIFLDEIGDMPQSLQAKLLRVLQDKRFTPLGGNASREADVRIIAATNKDLKLAMKRGSFRLDLYYRLNVLPLFIPPLRERFDDIPSLLEHFIENANRVQSVSSPCFLADDLIKHLCQFQWPGNVRQLQNLVERLVVLKGGGGIRIEDLPEEILEYTHDENENNMESTAPDHHATRGVRSSGSPVPKASGLEELINYPAEFGSLPSKGINLAQFVEKLENDYIRQALERTGNNKNQAAKLLGLNRTTLVERIKKRKIQPLNAPSQEL